MGQGHDLRLAQRIDLLVQELDLELGLNVDLMVFLRLLASIRGTIRARGRMAEPQGRIHDRKRRIRPASLEYPCTDEGGPYTSFCSSRMAPTISPFRRSSEFVACSLTRRVTGKAM